MSIFLKVHHWVLKSTLRGGSNFCLGFLGSFGARTKTLTIHHWQLHRPGSVSLGTGSLRGRFTLRRGTGATQRTAQDTRPPPGPPPAWPSVRLRGKSKLRNKQTGRQPHHLKLLPIIICRKCLIRLWILRFCTNLILLLTNILAFGSIWTRELNLANWRLQFATLAAAQSFQSQNWEEKQKWENMRPCACITKKAMLKMWKEVAKVVQRRKGAFPSWKIPAAGKNTTGGKKNVYVSDPLGTPLESPWSPVEPPICICLSLKARKGTKNNYIFIIAFLFEICSICICIAYLHK